MAFLTRLQPNNRTVISKIPAVRAIFFVGILCFNAVGSPSPQTSTSSALGADRDQFYSLADDILRNKPGINIDARLDRAIVEETKTGWFRIYSEFPSGWSPSIIGLVAQLDRNSRGVESIVTLRRFQRIASKLGEVDVTKAKRNNGKSDPNGFQKSREGLLAAEQTNYSSVSLTLAGTIKRLVGNLPKRDAPPMAGELIKLSDQIFQFASVEINVLYQTKKMQYSLSRFQSLKEMNQRLSNVLKSTIRQMEN